LVEIEDVHELVTRVGRLTHEHSKIDERENDVADVGAATNSPMVEYDSSHDAESIESQVAAGERQLRSTDMSAFIETLLAILEGTEHEQVCSLVEPRLAKPNTVHDAVAKCQFRHCLLR
jgi:hypothetical protein